MKGIKRQFTAIISVGLALIGLALAPLQVSADDSLKGGNQYFGEVSSPGNIFKLTGIDPLSLNDGIGVNPYKANTPLVDSLAAEYNFRANNVIGWARVNGSQIILAADTDSCVEFLITNGKMSQFELKTNILGAWTSPDGSVNLKVGSVQYFAPALEFGTTFQILSLTYFYAEYRSPANEAPAAIAAVSGYLDTDTMQFTSANNLCSQISGGWTLKDWNSTASNYGTSIYAGCDGHWTFFLSNRYHGAWVSIDNYGGVSRGGY